MMKTKSILALLRTTLVGSLVLLAGAAGAVTTVNLTAQRMSTTLPDGSIVPMWGYCATPTTGSCSSAWAPGPTITAPAGDSLTINLTNSLPVPTSIVILGQLGGGLGTPAKMASPTHAGQTVSTWPGNGAAAFTPPAQAPRVSSFATEVAGNATSATALTWTNLRPGTYLYETGTLPSIQAPMGLYGVLIVTQAPVQAVAAVAAVAAVPAVVGDPTASPPILPVAAVSAVAAVTAVPFAPGEAYPTSLACLANTTTTSPGCVAYDSDASLLFSEIDPVQNKAVDAAAVAGTPVNTRFDDPSCASTACYPAAVNYTPTYFLINGLAFDKTAPQLSAFAVAGSSAGAGNHSVNGNVLVRLLNAGSRTHVPSIVGLPMAIVAEDGNLAPGNPKTQNEVLLTAGKTHDVLVTPPSSGTTYSASIFPLFDRQLSLTSGNQLDGGMRGFLQVASAGATSGAGALPAAVTPTAVNDSFQVPLNASINGNVKLNDIAVAAVAVVTQPGHGTLSFNPDGTFVYTPTAGFQGADTFTYNGNGGTTNTATVTLNVASGGVGAAPVAVADAYTSRVSSAFSAARPGVLANDNDPSGYPLTAVNAVATASGTTPACASVALAADGSFSATPPATAKSCAFTYQAQNSQGKSSVPATVTLTFVPAGMATGVKVAVFDPASNVAVTDYRWIIQEDLTFKVDPTGTPSITTRTLGTSFHRSHMPVVATGCVGPVSCGSGQQVRTDSTGAGSRHVITDAEALALQTTPDLAVLDPAKNYYISILPGDAGSSGHTMGGAEIRPQVAGAWANVSVATNALPLVPAQLSIYIYEDNAPINGQDDLNEGGLGGFNIILVDAVGRSGDPAGQQTYDAFNMPLSNSLLGRPGCPDELNQNTNGTGTSATGNFVGAIYTCPNDPNAGTPLADPTKYALAGHALIKNITPARYDVIAHPGAARQGAGEVWWQTETLEGTAAQDAFSGVKEPVYFQEFGSPGFHTTIGFVNPDRVKQYAAANGLAPSNGKTITGHITNQRMSHPSDVTLYDSGSYDLLSATTCQVALNSQGGDGPAIAITQCDHNGNFTLTNIPAGAYELAIWDQWLDQIIQTITVNVAAADTTVAMGNIPVLSWFTQYDQNIFLDANNNGVYDPGEQGISNLTMTTRYRDGGISNVTATDSNGNAILAELFPLFNWYVTEADTTRFKQTGVNVIVDGGGAADTTGAGAGLFSSKYATGESSNRVELPGAYSYGMQGFISQRNTINWGRAPYLTGENGGIQGIVVYSSTRPFDDQRFNVQTLWEPLLPRVTVNLYRKQKLADGTDTLKLVDSTLTSSFDDWVNAVDASGKQVNLQCPGQKTSDPFYLYTLAGSDAGRCYDGWHNWNQVQAAPYDGRYQFPTANCAGCIANPNAGQPGSTAMILPPGEYVVETVTPPGYEVVKEEDKNILTGDSFVAPAPTQFGGLSNIFILPDQATLNNANPFNMKNADGIANNATSNLGATSAQLIFAECVGTLHRVPDYLSVFPGNGLVAPFAGMDRPLCDRKLVKLNDQMQAGANFFVFTQVPMAANGTGIILDDATSEFNAAAPDFGEKASVPFVPISVKDFNGRELSRLYSDQWGAFNMLTPSSWLVNPPTPSGYGPNMLVTCMNDPGPIKDPVSGLMVVDPQYNAAYSNFCYTLPFMPGRTTYLDTPVLPVAAFAAGYNPADCAYPDATPAIARVDSSAGFGPYVPAAGATLTLTALGDQKVPNPAYNGPFALTGPSSLRTLTRRYGFGLQGNHGKVTINGVAQTVTGWSDSSITVTIAAGTTTGELVVHADNGVNSIDTVTVTVGGTAPVRVQGAVGQTIQAAIDAAAPGALILVDAGTYNELLIMWKPVRLQGVGAASVIVNAAKYPTSKLEAWRPTINSLFSVDVTTGNSTATVTNPAQIDALPTQEITGGIVLLEPTVLGSEQGPGITVLAKNLPAGQCAGGAISTYGHPVTDSNFRCAPSRIDGISVTGGDSGGGIYVNGWAHNLEVSNNRVYGNAGAFNGGVRIGVPYLQEELLPTDNNNNIVGLGYDVNVKVHNNAITKNGTVESTTGAGGAGGGISICSGTDGYSVDHNWVCGNYSAADGGGIGHIGFSQNGSIANNQILFNQSFQQTGSTHGGGIIVAGEPPVAGTLSLGTGNVSIDANVIRGNSAEGGHGGGIRLQQVNGADVVLNPNASARWFKAVVTNNFIENNVAGYSGGGLSMADTLVSQVYNNTIASNDSTGIAGSALSNFNPSEKTGIGRPSPAGISSELTSAQLTAVVPTLNAPYQKAISSPDLANNIIWKNRSFFYDVINGNAALCSSNNVADASGQTCNQLVEQTTTGQCANTTAGSPVYWDLGVLGDTTTAPGVNQLQPRFSILTGIAGYGGSSTVLTANVQQVNVALRLATVVTTTAHGFTPGKQVTLAGVTTSSGRFNGTFTILAVLSPNSFTYTDSAFTLLDFVLGAAATGTATVATTTTTGNMATDPQLADMYCNGSRVTPEFPSVVNPPSLKSLQVAATLDEGNNFVSLRYGPLYLAKPTDSTGTTSVAFGDDHLLTSSPAKDAGTTLASVQHDIDGDTRPQGPAYDIGADEIVPPATSADLSITVTDGVSTVTQGANVSYTIVVANAGPSVATGATVTDTFPASLTVGSWTCSASAGSSCATGGAGNGRTGTVTLPSGGSATFTAVTTLGATATGSLVNTASVAPPAGLTDPNLANNSATDTDTILTVVARPALAVLDTFNRGNATNLGSNWSQTALFGLAAIAVNNNQAFDALLTDSAYWNVTSAGFGAKQAAAFTFANATVNGDSLVLKATGGSAAVPANFVRVRITGTQVVVETTTNGGGAFAIAGTLTATFGNTDTVTAMVNASGVVSVWKTTAANVTSFVGSAILPNVPLWTTGAGRIGMRLVNGARVDNFAGGTVP